MTFSLIVKTKKRSITGDAPRLQYETQCSLHLENMTNTFNELLKTLTALSRTDPEIKEKNRLAAGRLTEGMVNTLKEWPPATKTNLSVRTIQLGETIINDQ